MSIEQIESGSFSERILSAAGPKQFRIVSWNIQRGIRFEAILEFLHRANADLILLQEVDKNCLRTRNRNVASQLSQTLRMNYVFGTEFQELGQGINAIPAYHGQATLSPWPLLNPRLLRFIDQSRFWNPCWWIPPLPQLQRRRGGRMALVTDICIGGMPLTAYNLHLESRGGDHLRVAQLCEVLSDVRQREEQHPIVVGGDFNFDVARVPQSVAVFDSGFANPFGAVSQKKIVRSGGRGRMIDYILVRARARAVTANVHTDIEASDHYPLSLSLALDD